MVNVTGSSVMGRAVSLTSSFPPLSPDSELPLGCDEDGVLESLELQAAAVNSKQRHRSMAEIFFHFNMGVHHPFKITEI